MKFKVSKKDKSVTQKIKVPARDEKNKKVTYLIDVTYRVLKNSEFQEFRESIKPEFDDEGNLIKDPIKDVDHLFGLMGDKILNISGLVGDDNEDLEFNQDLLYSLFEDKDAVLPIYRGFMVANSPEEIEEARIKNS